MKRIVESIGRNFLGHVYGQLVMIAVQLLQAPVMVKCLGVGFYADWILILSIPSVLFVSDLGIPSAFGTTAVRKYIVGDRDGVLSEIGTANTLIYMLCFVVVVTLFVGALFLDIRGFLGVENLRSSEVNGVLIGVCLFMLCRLISSLVNMQWRVIGRTYVGVLMGNTIRLGAFASLFVGVYVYRNLVVAAMIMGGVSLVILVLFGAITMFCVGEGCLAWWLPRFSSASFKKNLKPSLGNLLMPLSDGLFAQGQNIIISRFFGGESLVAFHLCRLFSRLINQVTVVISNSGMTEYARIGSELEIDRFKRLLVKMFVIVGFVGLFGVCLVLGVKDIVVSVFIDKSVELSLSLILPLLVGSVLFSYWRFIYGLFQGLNAHLRVTLWIVFIKCVCLLFYYQFVGRFVLEFAGWVMLFTHLFSLVVMIVFLYAKGNMLICRLKRNI